MGCDIHMFVEGFKENSWHKVGEVFKNPYFPEYDEEKEFIDNPYICRNYELFALLANVRNENKEVIPISEPKGFPKDITNEVLNEYEKMEGCCLHSSSYYFLNELLNYNWDQEDISYHEFIKETIPCLQKTKEDFGFDVLRIVFWFDC